MRSRPPDVLVLLLWGLLAVMGLGSAHAQELGGGSEGLPLPNPPGDRDPVTPPPDNPPIIFKVEPAATNQDRVDVLKRLATELSADEARRKLIQRGVLMARERHVQLHVPGFEVVTLPDGMTVTQPTSSVSSELDAIRKMATTLGRAPEGAVVLTQLIEETALTDLKARSLLRSDFSAIVREVPATSSDD